jgi:hypothetical protein
MGVREGSMRKKNRVRTKPQNDHVKLSLRAFVDALADILRAERVARSF